MKLNYSANLNDADRHYDVLDIAVLAEYQYSKESGELLDSGVALRLQRGGDDRPHNGEWYGLSIRLETHGSNVSASSAAYRQVLGLCKKLCGYEDGLPTADAILTYLVEHGTQWVCDSRESPHYIKPEVVKPADYRMYCDGFEGSYCTVNVVANSEESAKKLICAKMATEERLDALQKWIGNGMPVRCGYYNSVPQVVDVRSLLTPAEAPVDVEVMA